jgi:hypothetical protein
MRVVILLLAILALSAFIGCQAKPMVVPESGSGSEGIKVHGDWIVEVTNPDGSLATRRQFRNEFVGPHVIAALLSLDLEVKRFMWFAFSDSPDLKVGDVEIKWVMGGFCKEAVNAPLGSSHVSANVIQAANDEGNFDNSVWNASCTLESVDGNRFLYNVATSMEANKTINPSSGGNASKMGVLSFKTLDEPIEVWDGQVVAATVILSVD